MTAGRERSAGQASLIVAARDRVSLRVAGGPADRSDADFAGTYSGVETRWTTEPLDSFEAAIVFAIREASALKRARLTVVMDDPAT